MKIKWWILGISIGFLIIVGMFSEYQKSNPSKVTSQPKPVLVKPPTIGLFSSSDVLNGNYEALHNVSSVTMNSIENTLRTYQNIPEVNDLKDDFSGKIYITYYTPEAGGTSKVIEKNNNATMSKFGNLNYLEVCLYSMDFAGQAKTQELLHYDHEWKALIVPGVALTEPWFSGFVLHELYHAAKDREGANSATAPVTSDSYIEEELMAHDIEHQVLDQATNGKYKAMLKRLAKDRNELRDSSNIVSSMKAEDYSALDSLFLPATEQESILRNGQYVIDLGSMWLEERYSGKELQEKRIAYYRNLRRNYQ